ncbi:MAG TPA: fibronectin type III domain-containing protein [Bacillota bacterium]|nr:fibronectin type III domain-containing protein [Bacillota bacterium]
MRRFLLISLCLALILSFFSGCGVNNNSTPNSGAYTVSGQITRQDNGLPLEGITLNFNNGQTVTTGPDGAWRKSGLSGTITVTPSKDGWAFDPPNRQLNGGGINANFIARNASDTTYAVSGKITNQSGDGIGSVVLTFSNGFGTAVTGSDGAWSKSGLWGQLNVTPAKNGWAFYPVSQILAGSASNIDFSGQVGTAPSAAPTTLASSDVSPSQVTLTWTDNSDNEQGFKIERKTGTGGTYVQIDTVTTNVETYTDSTLTQSTTYYFRVKAYNAYGDSGYSNEVQVNTTSGVPVAPSGLTATAAASTPQIDLSWTDNSGNETGFRIERKIGASGSYSQIYTVAAGTTSYSDTGLDYGTIYYYRIKAYNTYGSSGYSNEAQAKTVLGVPTLVYPNDWAEIFETFPLLQWSDVTGADGYEIQVASTQSAVESAPIIGTTVSEYRMPDIPVGESRYWRVRAEDGNWSATRRFDVVQVTGDYSSLSWIMKDAYISNYQISFGADPPTMSALISYAENYFYSPFVPVLAGQFGGPEGSISSSRWYTTTDRLFFQNPSGGLVKITLSGDAMPETQTGLRSIISPPAGIDFSQSWFDGFVFGSINFSYSCKAAINQIDLTSSLGVDTVKSIIKSYGRTLQAMQNVFGTEFVSFSTSGGSITMTYIRDGVTHRFTYNSDGTVSYGH